MRLPGCFGPHFSSSTIHDLFPLLSPPSLPTPPPPPQLPLPRLNVSFCFYVLFILNIFFQWIIVILLKVDSNKTVMPGMWCLRYWCLPLQYLCFFFWIVMLILMYAFTALVLFDCQVDVKWMWMLIMSETAPRVRKFGYSSTEVLLLLLTLWWWRWWWWWWWWWWCLSGKQVCGFARCSSG